MDAMQPIDGADAEEKIDRIWKEGNTPFLLSGQNMNLMEDYMTIIRCIGIAIDDKNDHFPYNSPAHQQQQQQK